MDDIAHGVTKSQTQLSDFHFRYFCHCLSLNKLPYTLLSFSYSQNQKIFFSTVLQVNINMNHLLTKPRRLPSSLPSFLPFSFPHLIICQILYSASKMKKWTLKILPSRIWSLFSVSKSCSTICDPMDCSTPGSSVLFYLMEFAQIHVYQVSDAV